MMNESRYKLSGSTHRNGMTATSCESLLVVASNSTDAIAGNATHNNLSTALTFVSATATAGAITDPCGTSMPGMPGSATIDSGADAASGDSIADTGIGVGAGGGVGV